MGTGYIVRYGATRNIAEFSARGVPNVSRRDAVIVRSERGVEWGDVLCVADEKTRQYLGNGAPKGRILRRASREDHSKLDTIRKTEWEEFIGCQEMIGERNLEMQLADVEHLFGGERIVFYYLAENRVDFRELVKALAKRFHARIEMRHIGVRDEAKLLADYGDCGKEVCCNTHLRTMPPVSMKMAKLQKATLDPSKISGRCGRLKCCLRYEYAIYDQNRRELPRIGSTVITEKGEGKVVAHEILSRNLLVAYPGEHKTLIGESEVLEVVDGGGN